MKSGFREVRNLKSEQQLELEYPQLRADIDLCYKYLFEMCKTGKRPTLTVPPQKYCFDMQMSAAFDELKEFRVLHTAPETCTYYQINEDNGHWQCSECDEEWVFNEGTPFENNMFYCPKCGRKLSAMAFKEYDCEKDESVEQIIKREEWETNENNRF
jgi:Zn finger protein HypA/HybF involved in hydrogenase expression